MTILRQVTWKFRPKAPLATYVYISHPPLSVYAIQMANDIVLSI